MTSPNPSGVTVTPQGWNDPHNFVPIPAPFDPGIPWIPADNGLLAATDDLTVINSTGAMVAGTVYLRRLNVRQSLLITNLWLQLQTAGVGASTGSFAGVYSSFGVLLAQTADIAAALTGALGPVSVPLAAPVPVAPGFVWLAVVSNLATSQPTLRAGSANPNIDNTNLAAAGLAAAVNGTGRTTFANPITPASNTGTNAFPFWFGVN